METQSEVMREGGRGYIGSERVVPMTARQVVDTWQAWGAEVRIDEQTVTLAIPQEKRDLDRAVTRSMSLGWQIHRDEVIELWQAERETHNG